MIRRTNSYASCKFPENKGSSSNHPSSSLRIQTKKKESKTPTSQKLESEEPSPCNLGSITPLSTSKDKYDRVEEDIRTHIRASPVPRPRAVLSSPVNDGIIGTKTKRTEERTSLMRPRKSDQKCNVTTKPSTTRTPRSGNEGSKEANKPCQLSTKVTNCSVTVKQSAVKGHRNGRVAPEDTLNKTACKGSVSIAFKIKD